MDAPSKDLDIEVFGIAQDRCPPLLRSLGRVDARGQSFPVYKLGAIDVALPRRESKLGRGHKGFAVEGDPSMSVAEAARRRDFTINAIGWDPLTGEYVDPFDGHADLARRLLRVVDPQTFADDSLRVLRALQFAARFEFALEDTARICRRSRSTIFPPNGSGARSRSCCCRPSVRRSASRSRAIWASIEQVLPELVPLYDCQQEPEWHPEGDVWTHTLMVIDEARELNGDLDRPRLAAMMLGAVCHDLGKPATTALIDGRIRSPGHEARALRRPRGCSTA